MLIGLNAIKTLTRDNAVVLDAWFDGAAEERKAPVATSAVRIHNSIKAVAQTSTAVPSLPRHAAPAAAAPVSPYQAVSNILDPNSRSSQWLAHYGLMQHFTSTDCFVDMSMTPEGGMNAVLRAPSGLRRTIVCRADGTSAQRVTGANGEELIRFNNDGEPVYTYDKAEASLAIA